MNYVFFDVECANCLNGEGKMCSFGFVKTDENFQVLKKKDILIDPNAKFLLGNAKTGKGIKLAYPLFKFKRAFIFPHYYDEIKRLLEDENNICFGFAVHQDVNYITYTCNRYGLPIIRFSFFDIQKFEQEIYQRKNTSGLDHLVEYFHVPSFVYHRSDDDSLMSMEVLKGILEEKKMDVKTMLEEFKDCQDDTDHFLRILKEKQQQKEKKKTNQKLIKEFYMLNYASNLEHYNAAFWNKKFFFSYRILGIYMQDALSWKKEFMKMGGIPCGDPYSADFVVVLDKKTKDHLNLKDKEKEFSYISYKDFLKMFKPEKKK